MTMKKDSTKIKHEETKIIQNCNHLIQSADYCFHEMSLFSITVSVLPLQQ